MIRPSCSCRERSIPACTGEPPQRRGAVGTCRVYPRVYGGTCCRSCLRSRGSGLSPRVRGNHGSHGRGGSAHGSIPACTGEPPQRRGAVGPCRVYPRVYGGTGHPNARVSCFVGLSPRVRGNRDHPAHCANPDRSIPACTGEPGDRQEARFIHRSIPACTGEPSVGRAVFVHDGVYPRVYGGTMNGYRACSDSQGLSPRVRGNHRRPSPFRFRPGSIPACTGEPWDNALAEHPLQGLSPRVRGNPSRLRRHPRRMGSIPACTGEPRTSTGSRKAGRVYPRVYGGTSGAMIFPWMAHGLSPRVRGNQVARPDTVAVEGSIPACTGEPRW